MLGFIGAVLTTASGAVAGETAAHALSLREEHLAQLADMLDRIDIYLSSYSMSTEELFARICRDDGVYSAFFLPCGRDLTAEVAARIRTSGLELKEELADYISRFGRTDLDGQLAQNRLLRLEVARALEQARERRERFSKIYRIAGISAGLTAALLLI